MGTIQGKLLAVLVLLLFSCGGTGILVHRYDAGQEAERTVKAQNQYAAALKQANDNARAKEADYANALSAASAAHQVDLKERDNALAQARSVARTSGLYVSAKCPDGGSALPGTTSGSGGGSSTVQVRLSDAASEYAINLASEADHVADVLRECQAIVTADRK